MAADAKGDKGGTVSIALVGNPNSGKTSVFNGLTGSRQHVGNWPGVTVEKKEGHLTWEGRRVRVTDLPGIYSLGAYSEDEIIARDYVLLERPDVVVDVVDSTNLERNLYLTVQLLEMGARVVVALNMFDELEARSVEVDVARLSAALGVPVVPTVATRSRGLWELVGRAVAAAEAGGEAPLAIDYGDDVERELSRIEERLRMNSALRAGYPLRWLAVKLLEGDHDLLRRALGGPALESLLALRDEAVKRIESFTGDDIGSLMADRRYAFISAVVREIVGRAPSDGRGASLSDRIDRVVTNRFLGLPIFLGAMWAVFHLTFTLSAPLADWIDALKETVAATAGGWLERTGAPDVLVSLVADGVVEGLGSVLVFVPSILLLFLAISILEDSGYMARAAYVMDRLMHSLGLHGKSFIPFLVAFGCNVPAIMAARTLDDRRDRVLTILITPLMSCTARLPVYVLFAGAFFGDRQGLVVFSLYVLGLCLAVLMGMLFRRLLFRGEASHFLMELPPYRMPTVRSTLIHVWERGSSFCRKAGTVILAAVVLVWCLGSLPPGVEYGSRDSLLGRLGGAVAPVLAPAGFGTWEAAVALISGLLAKEVVVGTLGVLYGVEDDGLAAAVARRWTPLSAYSFMVMTLLYIPCVAVMAAIRRETNSARWTWFAIGYTLVLGWTESVLVYQGGRLIGLE